MMFKQNWEKTEPSVIASGAWQSSSYHILLCCKGFIDNYVAFGSLWVAG